jgi:drug/metabolite transporter (DMT)-like permease
MFFLVATVLLNVVISVLFKLFPKFGIDAMQAIVVNYLVCVVTGCVFMGRLPIPAVVVHEGWFSWSVLMGAGFFFIFNLLAFCTNKEGISITILSNKLSLVIPVGVAVLLFHDSMNVSKLAGICLALPSIFLMTMEDEGPGKGINLWLPLLLFLGGGFLDTLMNFIQRTFLAAPDAPAIFSVCCFASAAVIGTGSVAFRFARHKTGFGFKNIVAGVAVGIPNFFSIYFFVKMLRSPFLQTSASIPLLNIGILAASVSAAVMLFHEKLNRWRRSGLLLALLSIVLIAYGDWN